MRVLVYHAGQQHGPFSLEEVQGALASGRFQASDLAWYEGLPAWVPLSSLVGPAFGSSPLPESKAPASGLAIASLVLGASSVVFCFLTGLPAVICGHLARGEIRRAGGKVAGDGMAMAGLVLGYLSIVLPILAAIFFLIFAGAIGMRAPEVLHSAQQAAPPQYTTNAAMQVLRACKSFAADHGGTFPETLEELVPFYLADRELLICPLSPQEPVGYFYFGGKETDNGGEMLMMTKGTDEEGRRLVIRKNGSTVTLHTPAPNEPH